ncbi:sigma 54-interacting transcriptional regulator [Aneurinibacillus tyrosinisolvens]|uniref:sigma 54-interacting transcriptional regulator n=1 Tax=Aneurinibacillus tyrosinisolvens TaxID=1443435 RepID=UPI00069B207C|nr:sigma 54-interacting transcriptional regulator [Aneurinibacillus tyrosinisolvens]
MNIDSILHRDFKTMMEHEWSNQPELLSDLGNSICIVFDRDNKIAGIVTREHPHTLIPPGILMAEELANPKADWENYTVTIFLDSKGTVLGWVNRDELYRHFYHQYRAILSSLPHEVVVIDKRSQIAFVNEQVLESHELDPVQTAIREPNDLYPNCTLEEVLHSPSTGMVVRVTDNKEGILTQTKVMDRNECIGAIQVCWEAEAIENIAMQLNQYANMAMDLKAIFESSYDVIYVSDGQGKTLRVSAACEELWGYKAEELIGKTVYELERMGVYKPSITRLVLEKRERVQVIQTTKTDRRLMVVGTPIKDESGNIVRVVNASRDITEESQLKSELEDMKLLMEGFKQELNHLRRIALESDTLVFKSERMESVTTLARKVAGVDSTILIQGESGVGKEVISSYIHEHSERKNKPFIKVNCGAIPENLLESELFGYEKGAFTGASKTGKPGLFELAHEGTLFLDEIGEVPLSLQVKLLRVLQEGEFVRVGGTKPLRANVRIIAATNRNLQEETRLGNFREDLYYRLNVIPILIPPLRERKEDIVSLALFFIQKFNDKYKRDKVFAQDVLEVLQSHSWRGNVRELQNIIERLIVTTDNPVIKVEHLPDAFTASRAFPSVQVSDIMPMKDAIDLVERQLLALAKRKYKTTVKIAEVLGVNQSTVSRKITKMKIE